MEENKNFTTVENLNTRCDEKYLDLINNRQIKDILSTMGKFVKETIENDILIIDQMPEAKQLCSKAEWEKIKHRELIDSPKYVELVGVTLYKNEQGPIDEKGSMHVIGTNKLHPYVRTVYDVSQTTGDELPKEYDKEELAKYFDTVKNSLEHITKGYTVRYEDDIDKKSYIDKENKQIVVKNGMSLISVINELIDNTTKVLLNSRRQEGLSSEQLSNVNSLEWKAAVYAIHSRYNLDLPEFDFSEVEKLSNDEKMLFRDNLGKVRSVVYQLTHNLENSIEFTMREQNKDKSKDYQSNNTSQKENTKQNQNDGEEL